MDLIFNANLSHSFYYAADAIASPVVFERRLKAAFPEARKYTLGAAVTSEYQEDMQTVERFLKGGSQTYEVTRFFLPTLCPEPAECGFTGVCLMASYFVETGVFGLSMHYSVQDVTADTLIGLRQSGTGRKYRFPTGDGSFSALAERVCRALGLPTQRSEEAYLCEITRFGDVTDMRKIGAEYAKLLYGLITGDEGYEFVPHVMVEERLGCNWGSRDFMRIFAIGQGFLFLNLLEGERHDAYLERQTQYGTDIYGAPDPYFFLGSCPLSVNHGIWFSVEFVMMLKTLVNGVLAFQAKMDKSRRLSYYRRIRMTHEFRRKIIMVLEKVEHTAIHEIGNLSSVLMESQNIAPVVDQVKYLLELLEADLSLTYSERNNLLVTVLTVIGLLFAAAQIVMTL